MTQRVLITAGAGGIGLAMAQAFLKNGAKVHISDMVIPPPINRLGK